MAKKNAGRRGAAKGSRRPPVRSRKRSSSRKRSTASRKRSTATRKHSTTKPRTHQASSGGAKRRAQKTRAVRRQAKPSRPVRRETAPAVASGKKPRLDRARRTLDDTVQTPPSSLNLDRHASAARTGRAELQESIHQHTGMTPALTGGDVDADWENAYFSGDEAPGGDNPTPDQEVVDDIGRSLGVVYQDNEELRASDKVVERDKHRWELDPASSEDFKDRK